MPRNKKQELIFGIIMSYVMAYGMEVYNIAISQGIDLAPGGFSNMTNHVFGDALKEAAYMGLFVFIFSNLWGNHFGAAFAARHCDPAKDNPYICQILRQAGTARSHLFKSGLLCYTEIAYEYCIKEAVYDSFLFPKRPGYYYENLAGGQSGCPPLYFAGLLDFPKPPGSGTASTGKDFGVGIRGDRPSLCRNAGGIPSRNFRRPLLSFQRNRRRTFPAAQILLSIIPPERI